jgi:hypothetical protein
MPPAVEPVRVQTSRLLALFQFAFTRFLMPDSMTVDANGIVTEHTNFWLTPWVKSRETAPLSRLASIQHDKGLIWDKLSVETSGGSNPLDIAGVPKGQARRFVEVARALIDASHKGD